MEVEKQGLTGKIYLDARGLAKLGQPVQPNSYADYDQSLLRAAEMIKQGTELEVVLDTQAEVFAEGTCPQAALYCGWYRLANYCDAFDWVPGAVGYHMGSSEATTLRKADSQVWCKRMLEDGVTATLGPAYEPYISAFPRPDEFLGLLLSGKFTLVEAYYRCLPHTSWTMVLVGDPLYTPYKASSPLKLEGIDEPLKTRLRRVIDGPQAEVTPLPATEGAAGPAEAAS